MQRHISEALAGVSVLCFLAAVVYLIGQCGCASSEPAAKTADDIAPRVENGAAVAQYDAILAECVRKGEDAGSFAVFGACERETSARLCRESEGLRREWPRCKEVLP